MTPAERYRIKVAKSHGLNSWEEWIAFKKKKQDELYAKEPWRKRMQEYYQKVSRNNPEYIMSQNARNKLRYIGKTKASAKPVDVPMPVASTCTYEWVNQRQLDLIFAGE